MGIVHVRIDDRLIHGQVATMWTNYLGVNRIMVIDDKAASDDFFKNIIKIGGYLMALPFLYSVRKKLRTGSMTVSIRDREFL